MATELTVVTFNLHGGVDAWGRRYDAVSVASSLGADVLLLQETWNNDGEPTMAQQIAHEMDATVHEVELARGRRAQPHESAPARWSRARARFDGDHALYLDSVRPLEGKLSQSARVREATPGSLGLAIVSRLPLSTTRSVDLGPLRRDRARRSVLIAETEFDGGPIQIVCVHMGHLTHGSPRHFSKLSSIADSLGGPHSATIIGGDMNLWGPPVSLQMRGWHRAVKDKTWPSWRPHSQIDHLLVGDKLRVVGGRAVDERGSDHRPLLARLRRR